MYRAPWLVAFVLLALQPASANDLGGQQGAGNESCQDPVPLIQLERSRKFHSACAEEIWRAAAKTIKEVDSNSPSEHVLMKAFEEGCNSKTSPLSQADCLAAQISHEKTLAQILQKLNSLDSPPLISFNIFAMMTMFHCVWKNRQDEFDTTYVGKPFNHCPLEHVCSGIVTSKEFDEQIYSKLSEEISDTSWETWPGTGEVQPMLRVSLLHRSDGTASARQTFTGKSGLRVSCINGGWALPCNLNVTSVKYSQSFQIAWGPQRDGMGGQRPLSLQSAVIDDTGVVAKMPPAAGNPITMVIIGDPCNGNSIGFGQCVFRAFYGVNRTLPLLLNVALKSSDLWYLTGDNFYDRYGRFTVGVFAQLSKEAQGVPLLATPGNHDYWSNGIPSIASNSWLMGHDQFANGHAQFFAQDSQATFEPKAPAADQIYPSDTPMESFTAAKGGFLNFAASPTADAKATNFYHYSIAGNIGLVMFTPVGEDPRNFVTEACAFMKQNNPKLVLFLGHWNMAGTGCLAGRDVPSMARWALSNTDCSAFRGSTGEPPFGPIGRAASRLKFIVGHQHCNCMTNFEKVAQDACLPDNTHPALVDGFVIGSHGMSWDPYPGEKPSCSSRFGFPVLRTDDNKLTFAYAKLSQDVMPNRPVTDWQALWAYLGQTPDDWSFKKAGPFGAGILASNLTALLSCLEEHGTNQCSRNATLFDQWYSADLV